MKMTKLAPVALTAALVLTLAGCSGGNNADEEATQQEATSEQGAAEPEAETPTETYSVEGVWQTEGAAAPDNAFDNKYYMGLNQIPAPYELTPDADDPNTGTISFTTCNETITGNYTLTSDTLTVDYPQTGNTVVLNRVSDDPATFDSNVQQLEVGKEFENDDLAWRFDEAGWADDVIYDDDGTSWVFGNDEEGSTYLRAIGTLDNFMSQSVTCDNEYHAYILLNGDTFTRANISSPELITESMNNSTQFFYASISDKKKDDIKSAVLYITFDGVAQEMEAYTFALDLL